MSKVMQWEQCLLRFNELELFDVVSIESQLVITSTME